MDRDFARQVQVLLSDVVAPLKRAKCRRREQALDYNVFKACAISQRELSHSAFLASLLDPNGSHGQGTLFLKSFLLRFGIDAAKDSLNSATVHIEYPIHIEVPGQETPAALLPGRSALAEYAREDQDKQRQHDHPIENERRLDILVLIPGGPLIAIENKVGAREQNKQLIDYDNWLKKESEDRRCSRKSHLIFLTPDGRKSTSGVGKPVSYSKIAEWLQNLLHSLPRGASRLYEVVKQYAEMCAELGETVRQNFDADVMKILEQPEQERLAVELSPYIDALRLRVAKRFWEVMRRELDRLLTDTEPGARWETKIELENSQHFRGIVLVPKGMSPNDKYCVGIHLWPGGSFVAVQRPKNGAASDTALLATLQRHGYRKSDSNYPGFRYTTPNLELNNIEGLRSQLDDIADTGRGHPMAQRLASEVFGLFSVCRKELEQLNHM